MDSGAQYVVTGGTIEMPLLCADNWDMMDVSDLPMPPFSNIMIVS